MSISQRGSPDMGGSHPRHVGHTHFWERAMLSRRQFMETAAGATGVVLASGFWMPGRALADNAAPRPIPGGIQPFGPGTELFHVFPIAPGVELSTITDFHGSIGGAEVQGTGTATNTGTGATSALLFDVDMRFMQGVYVGMDGETHRGTFSFI
ncbi:MAG TPA: twin-arginine translocation signal domain-containing protein [Ktedonobacteraceae bacterium]|nr:twin-arginine translocation signal domain-containing protein [Ktedonobacteraceae bacterium]